MMTGKRRGAFSFVAVIMFFLVIPHIVMSIPNFSTMAYRENWTQYYHETGIHDKTIFNVYLNLVWGLMPLAGSLIAMIRVLSNKEFNPGLLLLATSCIMSFFFRIPVDHVVALLMSVVLLGFVESFTLLSNWAVEKQKNSIMGKVLSGAAKNRNFLVIICFMSVVPISVFQIQGYYLAQWGAYVGNKLFVIVNMLVIPLAFFILTIFQRIEHPMTMGGVVSTCILYAVTMLFSVVGYNATIAPLEMFVIPYSIGYGLVLAVTGLTRVIQGNGSRE